MLEWPGDNREVFRQHVPFPFKQLKELKEACNKYSPTAPFTLTILEAMTTEALPAGDWKSLAHACLTGGDYLLWKSELYENRQKTARTNAAQQISIVFDMLTGEGQYAEVDQQLVFQLAVYAQTNAAARRAWKALPESTSRTEEVSKIRQGPDEPFQEFVAHLWKTARRTFGESEASTALVTQLAYENTNSACQAVLRPFWKKATLSDYICLCSDTGPSYTQGLAMAAALQRKSIKEVMLQQTRSHGRQGPAGACFNCGQMEHIGRQCPRASRPPANQGGEATLPLCLRCKKGKHWAKDCRSRFDKDGHPLQGNWQRSQPQAPNKQCYGALQETAENQASGSQALSSENPFKTSFKRP